MKIKTIFRLLSVIGLALSAGEIYGIVVSSPICKTSGCLIVGQITPFGDKPFVIAGLILFSFFIISSFYSKLSSLIDFVISLSLITEGALLGFQLFYIRDLCTICVVIAIIIGLMFLIRFFRKGIDRTVFYMAIAGFAALILLSRVLYIPIWYPPQGTSLIYSSSCPHCDNIIQKIKTGGKAVKMINLKKARGFLINNGIKSVPVLIVKDKNIRLFIGEDQIAKQLFKKNTDINGSKMLDELKLDKTDSCNFETDNCDLPAQLSP